MQIRSRHTVYLLLIVVMLFWSGNSIVARALHDDVPPFTLAFLRWTGASLIVLPLARTGIVADWPMIRRHWPTILMLGIIGVGSFNALLYLGLQGTTASNSLLIFAAMPALVLLLQWMIFRARATLGQIVGVLLSMTGVLIIVFKADVAAMRSLSLNRGDALVFGAAIVWSLYMVLLRLRPAIGALSFLALTFLVGVAAMLPLAAIELRSTTIHLRPDVLGGILYVAIFPSVIAYFLFNRAVEEIGAASAGEWINLQPLFGALLAALLLGEALHAYHLVGMALILAGIGLPQISTPEKEARPPH